MIVNGGSLTRGDGTTVWATDPRVRGMLAAQHPDWHFGDLSTDDAFAPDTSWKPSIALLVGVAIVAWFLTRK